MRVRYLIEEYPAGVFNLSLVDSAGEDVFGGPSSYATMELACAAAEGARGWKLKPEWNGYVSQTLNYDPDTGEVWA